MAGTRYGTKLYGTSFYGGDTLDEFRNETFKAAANGYGRALVSWTRPGGAWSTQRLVRNLVGTPVDELDGDVLLEEPTSTASTRYQDEGLAPAQHYYYALFVRDLNSTAWMRTGSAELLATRDYGYTGRLYDRVPQVFKSTSYNALDDSDGENETLLRFLELFGLQLDHVRTELDGLRRANDPRYVSSTLLPALAAQVGVTYEPELGDRAVRRFVANATRLYSTKGTLAGAREMATTFTGWDTTVRIGTNLALDRLDAGPDGGIGRWSSVSNATTSYRAFTDADRGPGGQGAVVITAVAAGEAIVDTVPAADTAPRLRMQYATPIIPNLPYVVSQYVRAAGTGVTARAGITWLDAFGAQLGTTSYGDPVPVRDDWSARPAHTLVAPAGARYLEYRLAVAGLAAGATARACALAIQERTTVLPWTPAREVVLYMRGDLTNYVGNTSGYGLSAEGWSKGVVAGADGSSSYLAFTSELEASDETLTLLDALTVDYPGDVSPDKPKATYEQVSATLDPDNYAQRLFRYPTYGDASGADTSRPAEGFTGIYTAGIREVHAGETWSVLVDAGGRFGEFDRTARVGFALYDGDDLVGFDWAEDSQVGADFERLGHQLQVDDNAPYDGVAFAVYSANRVFAWRNAALEPVQLLDARQFDGSTPSATLDYIWHGVPHRSATSYYSRRIVRTLRLRELLDEFLPHPASYRLVFAPGVIPDSPRASAGSDLDPDDEQTTTVTARARSRWNVTGRPGASLGLPWRVQSLQVSADVTARWNLDQLHKLRGSAWTVTELVGREVRPRWTTTAHTLDDLEARWNVTVPAALQLSMQWAAEQLAGSWSNSQWNVLGNPVAGDITVRWNVQETLATTDALVVNTTQTYAQTDTGGTYADRLALYPTYGDASREQ